MSFFKSLIASSALLASVLAHPHAHDKRSEPTGTVITSCTVPGVVALTFDDGPYIYTNTLLDRLASYGFRATFFQNGQNWGSIYDYSAVLKRMITDHHQIASHTWDHKDLATLSDAAVSKEMTDLEAAYTSILGYYPYYMRPPYLSTSPAALNVLNGLGYVVITIDIDTQDWQNLQVSQEQYSFNNYTTGYAAGGRLSLSHDPYNTTVNGYIPELLDWINGKGLKSVTVGECLGDAPANWYRTTRTNTFNPYVAVVSSSQAASSSPSASPSVAPSSSKAASSSVPVSASASASKISSSVAASASASKASSSVAVSASASASVAASASASKASSVAASASASKASSAVASSAAGSASVAKPSSVAASVSPVKASSAAASASPVASKASSAAAAASSAAGKVSSDGSCGGSKGYVCGTGECCSQYGWCGASTDYCGTGCQSSFGSCGATTPSGPTTVSPDWTCGGTSGYTCPDSNCCSQYGWCGSSSDYCGTGCQSTFGTCS